MSSDSEENKWETVKRTFQTERVVLGRHASFNYLNNPRHLLHSLSRYKFSSKLIGKAQRVLEVGCSDGFCTNILAEVAGHVLAVDIDEDAIGEALDNPVADNVEFKCLDITDNTGFKEMGCFDAVVSMDVIEHILPEDQDVFLDAICRVLELEGMCIIGTPNATASQYASKASRDGHVNLFDAQRIEDALNDRFKKTLIFSMNDEVIHTGYHPMAHYLIGVGIFKK